MTIDNSKKKVRFQKLRTSEFQTQKELVKENKYNETYNIYLFIVIPKNISEK